MATFEEHLAEIQSKQEEIDEMRKKIRSEENKSDIIQELVKADVEIDEKVNKLLSQSRTLEEVQILTDIYTDFSTKIESIQDELQPPDSKEYKKLKESLKNKEVDENPGFEKELMSNLMNGNSGMDDPYSAYQPPTIEIEKDEGEHVPDSSRMDSIFVHQPSVALVAGPRPLEVEKEKEKVAAPVVKGEGNSAQPLLGGKPNNNNDNQTESKCCCVIF